MDHFFDNSLALGHTARTHALRCSPVAGFVGGVGVAERKWGGGKATFAPRFIILRPALVNEFTACDVTGRAIDHDGDQSCSRAKSIHGLGHVFLAGQLVGFGRLGNLMGCVQ